jgi:N-acyl-D-amino-acid deacylase
MRADLVVFDTSRIADAATFSHPKAPALGIASVYVNGRRAWHEGRHTGARTGQVVRRVQ